MVVRGAAGALYAIIAIGWLIFIIFYNVSLDKFGNLPYGMIVSITIGIVGVASSYILIVVLLSKGED